MYRKIIVFYTTILFYRRLKSVSSTHRPRTYQLHRVVALTINELTKDNYTKMDINITIHGFLYQLYQ